MTNPSHLKVRYLFELPELPPGEVENSWTYTYVPNGPDKDYKVFLPTLIEEAVDDVSADILQTAADYTDQEVDQVRQDLLNPADSLGTDMVTYKLDDTNSVARGLRDRLGDIVSIKDFGADTVGDSTSAVVAANTAGLDAVYVPEGEYTSTVAPEFRVRGPGAIVVNGRKYTEADWMFGGWAARRTKRRLFANIPFIFPDYFAAGDAAEEPNNRIYPQTFAMDWQASRIYIIYDGLDAGLWHVVVAFDMWTHEYISCFLAPYTGPAEGCYIRYVGGVPYMGLREGDDFKEYALDPMPANLSKPSPANTIPNIAVSNQFSYDSDSDSIAVVETAAITGGWTRRYTAQIRDMSGNYINRVSMPLYLNSGVSTEPLVDDLPKKQGTAYKPPYMAMGLGGYSSDPTLPYGFNGAAICNLDGDVMIANVYYTDKVRTKLGGLLGHTFTRLENEGVLFAPDGRVFTFNVMNSLNDPGNHAESGGLVIFEEFSEHPDAIDFGDCLAPMKLAGAAKMLDTPVWPRVGSTVATNYYLHPLTGEMVKSWKDITDTMAALDLRKAGYYTSFDGNTGVNPGGILAFWGSRIPNGHHVEFTNLANYRFHVRVTGPVMNASFDYDNLGGADNWSRILNFPAATANAATVLDLTHLNTVVEKSNNTAYTYTLAADLGTRGDVITVVNSGTSGNVTIARDTGVALYEGGTDADITVSPGTSVKLYKANTANRWIAIR